MTRRVVEKLCTKKVCVDFLFGPKGSLFASAFKADIMRRGAAPMCGEMVLPMSSRLRLQVKRGLIGVLSRAVRTVLWARVSKAFWRSTFRMVKGWAHSRGISMVRWIVYRGSAACRPRL